MPEDWLTWEESHVKMELCVTCETQKGGWLNVNLRLSNEDIPLDLVTVAK